MNQKAGWWNLCKTVVWGLAFFCVTGAFLCGGVIFVVWLIGGLLTGQWAVPDDGLFFGCFVLFCGGSIVCIVVGLPMWILRWLLRTWVGPVLRRFYFILCFALPILGFVIGCEDALYDHRGFSTWDWNVFWHGTRSEKEAIQRGKEARYMHMTNAEKWEEFVTGIKGGAFVAFVSLGLLGMIAGLAGVLDDEETDK